MNNINASIFKTLLYANGLEAGLLRVLIVLLICLFGIAVLPEKPARLLTSADGWELHGTGSNKVLLTDLPVQYRHVRRTAVESPGGQVFRTWTPESGIVSIELTSSLFRPSRYMSVVITGANVTQLGSIQSYIECEQNQQRLEIFRGSVNVNINEAIVISPEGWCPGDARLKFSSTEKNINVGVGSVYEISYLSYLKSSFLGRLPYYITAVTIFSLVMLAGASLVLRLNWYDDLLPIALVSLGVASLAVFYITSAIPENWRWLCLVIIVMAILLAFVWSGREARAQAIRVLTPYAFVWSLSSLVYFAVLGLSTNALGNWDPNYRFWPAIWSSDNELPWMFAEALRRGWDLKLLFGGGWLPTDRPPLMAGAHLLLTDAYAILQSGNDGSYLTGQAYNAAAVVLNSLWVPAVWWLLTKLREGIDDRSRIAILIFVGCLPFVLFNTVYGWPKAFGAAFALTAFGLAWQFHKRDSVVNPHTAIVLFFVLGALSMLAHASTGLFLAPLGLVFLWWTLRSNTRSVMVGFAIALAVLASWSLYKSLVLPSENHVVKYALTGDYGFGHPDWSLWHMLFSRYTDLNFWQWLDIKRIMLLQAFLPLNQPIAQIGMNSDFGAGTIDKLRAWDFMLLSKGNLAVPISIVLVIWAAMREYFLHSRDMFRTATPFLLLIVISAISWLLMVFGFLVPPVIHHWPQAALFGLALSGAVVVHDQYPFTFRVMLLATMTYTGVVWILSPLKSALAIDVGAALVLVALGSFALTANLRQIPLPERENTSTALVGVFSFWVMMARLGANSKVRRIGNAVIWTYILRAITIGAFFFVTYITFRYIQQPLADAHAFRQTQTAISSYWMLKEGWSLAYQTPISGFPWSIPFEFPIYQAIVAAIVSISGLELEPVGRFVSYAFLVACAWPAFELRKRLDLPSSVPWVFCALLWTSPINVYWGRTFMIETAALFFSFACIPFAIDLIRRVGGWHSSLLFIILATAAVLQKSTTGGPVLLFLMLATVFVYVRKSGINLDLMRRLFYPVVIISVPLIIGLIWARYADVVKMANPFGTQLTSSALTTWNFGSIEQKLDYETWKRVVWERSLGWNAAGFLGVLLLLLPWLGGLKYRRFAWLSLAALALFALPILIFTNLHFIHEYYQVACIAYLLAALAIVIGGWLKETTGTVAIVPIATIVIIFANISFFNSAYGIVVARSLDELAPRSVQSYKLGRYLREHTLPNTGLVIFGQDYSSEVGFQAQRKSVTVPTWFKEYKQLWEHPRDYLGGLELSAIVICPPTDQFPTITDMQERLAREPEWVHESVYGCEILLSPAGIPAGDSSV